MYIYIERVIDITMYIYIYIYIYETGREKDKIRTK